VSFPSLDTGNALALGTFPLAPLEALPVEKSFTGFTLRGLAQLEGKYDFVAVTYIAEESLPFAASTRSDVPYKICNYFLYERYQFTPFCIYKIPKRVNVGAIQQMEAAPEQLCEDTTIFAGPKEFSYYL